MMVTPPSASCLAHPHSHKDARNQRQAAVIKIVLAGQLLARPSHDL